MAENTNNTKTSEVTLDVHAPFNSINESTMVKSRDFAGMVSAVFENVFEDFEGCIMELDLTANQPILSMIFNHVEREHPEGAESLPKACTKEIDTKTKNYTIRRIRNFQHNITNGDTYSMTEEAKQLLEKFILNAPRSKDKNGKVKWDDIVCNVADGANVPPQQQYTKLGFLDVNKLAKFLYGGKTEDETDRWIYQVKVKKSMPGTVTMQQRTGIHDFIMEISRIKEGEVVKKARDFGFGMNMSGLDIVRSIY